MVKSLLVTFLVIATAGSLEAAAVVRTGRDASEVFEEIRSIGKDMSRIFNDDGAKIGRAVAKIDAAFDNIVSLAPHISQNERVTITNAMTNMLNLQKRIPFIGDMMGTLAEDVERKAPRVGKLVSRFEDVETRPKVLKAMLVKTKSMLSGSTRSLRDLEEEYVAANRDIQGAEVSVAIFEAMMKRTEKNFDLINDLAIPVKDIVQETVGLDFQSGLVFESKEDNLGLSIIEAVENALPKLINIGYSIANIANSPNHKKTVDSLKNNFADIRSILKEELKRIRSEHKNAESNLKILELTIDGVANVQNLDAAVEQHGLLSGIKKKYEGISAEANTYHNHLIKLNLSEKTRPLDLPPPTTTSASSNVPSITKTTTASTTSTTTTSTTTSDWLE
jgi:hypothetical protein